MDGSASGWLGLMAVIFLAGCGPTAAGSGSSAGTEAGSASGGTAAATSSSTTGAPATSSSTSSSTSSTTSGGVCVELYGDCAVNPCCEGVCSDDCCGSCQTCKPAGAVPVLDDEPVGCFATPPDLPPIGCDPGLQDCPDGEKCTGFVTMPGECCIDGTHCVPVSGDKQLGEPCTRVEGDDDCAADLFCMTETSGSTGMGLCMEYCVLGDDSTCSGGGVCFNFNEGALPLCLTECDPLLQDCTGGQGCYSLSDTFACGVPSLGQGGTDGDPCLTYRSCEPGLVCVDGSSLEGCAADTCCTAWCDLTAPDPNADCTGLEECVPWFEQGMAPAGHEDVGACLVPA